MTETVTEPKPKPPYRFNAETARINALKSHAPTSKRHNKPPPAPEPEQSANEGDNYKRLLLTRVRSHLDRVDKLLTTMLSKPKPDARTIEQLARARTAFEEGERRASDRSLPAVLRVAEVKTGARSNLLSGLPD